MAKWNDRPLLTSSDLQGNFRVLVSDETQPTGQKDANALLDELRVYLGAGITVGVTQATHGLAVGDVVRHNGTNYVQATADTAANAEAVGVVTSVPDAGTFAYQTAGVAATLSGLTPGELYYLQDDGSLGASAGTVEKPILIATSATSAVLILAISGAGGGGDTSGLLPKLAEVNAYAGNRTLGSEDAGAYVRVTAAGTVALPDGLPTGFQAVVVNATDAATVELTAATALTIPTGFEPEIQNRRAVTVIHVGSNVWEAHGALVETP